MLLTTDAMSLSTFDAGTISPCMLLHAASTASILVDTDASVAATTLRSVVRSWFAAVSTAPTMSSMLSIDFWCCSKWRLICSSMKLASRCSAASLASSAATLLVKASTSSLLLVVGNAVSSSRMDVSVVAS